MPMIQEKMLVWLKCTSDISPGQWRAVSSGCEQIPVYMKQIEQGLKLSPKSFFHSGFEWNRFQWVSETGVIK